MGWPESWTDGITSSRTNRDNRREPRRTVKSQNIIDIFYFIFLLNIAINVVNFLPPC
jgi:hypothetical protein